MYADPEGGKPDMVRITKWALAITAAATLIAAIAAMGCASVRPEADALLVRSEQTLAVSFELADAFLQLEAAHSTELAAVAPWAPSIAQQLRERGPRLLRAAEQAIALYRELRTPSARETMLLALAEPKALVDQAELALAQWAKRGAKKGGGS